MLVPPPQLTLTITPSTTPLYEGRPVNLTCSAVLNTSVVNTAVTVSSVWTGPSGEQLTSSSHITVMDMLHSSPYTSVVVFDQVDDTDSGDYQCNITVSPADNNAAVLPATSSTTDFLNVTIAGNQHRQLQELYTNCLFLTLLISFPSWLLSLSVPSDSPQDIQAILTMTSLFLTWRPPLHSNGVIIMYNITVMSAQQTRTITVNGSTLSVTVCGLQPDQQVCISIRASTAAGQGPEAVTNGTTERQGELA